MLTTTVTLETTITTTTKSACKIFLIVPVLENVLFKEYLQTVFDPLRFLGVFQIALTNLNKCAVHCSYR